ncbi:MAG: ferredoxin-thioredoxin reductase catalytic domain-containing protein [Candidatus Nezhaarchaeales archaeon]
MKSRFAVILYTADYGCVECEVLEELIEKEKLKPFIDLKVVITHDEESLDLAERLGVDGIPLLIVKKEDGKLKIDDPDPQIQLKKLKEAIKHRIELYNKLKKQYEEHAKKLSQLLGKKVVVNHKVIPLIIKQVEEYGKPYCPCRIEKNEKTICPCYYHVEELKAYKRCRCGLFMIREDA